MDTDKRKNILRKYLLNKYVIVLLVFAITYLFVGNQGLIKRIRRQKVLRQTEQRLQEARQDTERAKHTLQVLQDPDSLERYAREHYGMHADGEEVYRINE